MDKTFSQGEPITASDHVAMNTETDAEVAEADASGDRNRKSSGTRPRCLGAALDYAERGISVILLHGIVDGRCTCGKTDCPAAGKHPINSWKRAQSQRASAKQLEAAFSSQPNANLGIVTGAISGIVVIDIDGPDGFDSFCHVMTGDPPLVPTVKTGNGHHLYGRHPGGTLKNFVKHHPGLDGRADGGYVVAPPSGTRVVTNTAGRQRLKRRYQICRHSSCRYFRPRRCRTIRP